MNREKHEVTRALGIVRGELIPADSRPVVRETLEGLLPRFFLVSGTVRHQKTREHYSRAVRWLGEMLGGAATVDDLSDDNLAALLGWLQQNRGQGPATANTSHKCLCRLWRWLRDKGVIHTGPTVAKLKEAARTPKAWTADELRRLVQAAARSPGTIGGMPARHWWLSLLCLEWDTGCRASELLSLRWEWLDWSRGWLHVPAESRKGGARDAVYGLMPDTLSILGEIRKAEGLILGWDRDRTRYYQLWNGLLERAELPNGRYRKTQCLRRSFASHLAMGGGDATAALGHANRATTVAHYLDPTITAKPVGGAMPFRLSAFIPAIGEQ